MNIYSKIIQSFHQRRKTNLQNLTIAKVKIDKTIMPSKTAMIISNSVVSICKPPLMFFSKLYHFCLFLSILSFKTIKAKPID